jgi:hypothetical protein
VNREDLEKLQRLIKGMDLPIQRKTQTTPHNIRWLSRNLGVRNSEHPKFQEAKLLLVKLLREDINEERTDGR